MQRFARPQGKQKMKAGVRKNGDFLQVSRVGPSVNRDSELLVCLRQSKLKQA